MNRIAFAACIALAPLAGCVATPEDQQGTYDGEDAVRSYKGLSVADFATYSGLSSNGAYDTDEGRVFSFVGQTRSMVYQPRGPSYGNIQNPKIRGGFQAISAGASRPPLVLQSRCEIKAVSQRINNRGNLSSFQIKYFVDDGYCGEVYPPPA